MVYNSAEVVIEIVQEVSLLCQIWEQLVTIDVIFNGILRVKMLLDGLETVLQGVEAGEADLSQIQWLNVGLLRLEIGKLLG